MRHGIGRRLRHLWALAALLPLAGCLFDGVPTTTLITVHF